MKKSDLVAGKHVVQYRDGNIRFVGEHGTLLDDMGHSMHTLNNYDESLLRTNGSKMSDIVAVYELNEVWKREEPTITEDEKTILRNLPSNYEWIARDKNGMLCVYPDKPSKGGTTWWGSLRHRSLDVFDHLFKMVKWEDDEPWKIEDLLNLEVKKDG